MAETKSDFVKVIGLFLVVLVIGYPLYLALVWLGGALSYLGYNYFFYMDNLLYIKFSNPIVSWSILGLFFGMLPGTFIAIKKYKLNPTILSLPLLALALLLTMMGLINKPADYETSHFKLQEPEPEEELVHYFVLQTTLNVRSGPSTAYPVLFVLEEGTEVVALEMLHPRNTNETWFRIVYEEKEGFVNARYLRSSRTETKESP